MGGRTHSRTGIHGDEEPAGRDEGDGVAHEVQRAHLPCRVVSCMRREFGRRLQAACLHPALLLPPLPSYLDRRRPRGQVLVLQVAVARRRELDDGVQDRLDLVVVRSRGRVSAVHVSCV